MTFWLVIEKSEKYFFLFKDLECNDNSQKEATQYIKLKNCEEEAEDFSNSISNEENCGGSDPPPLTDTEDTDNESEFSNDDDDESRHDDSNEKLPAENYEDPETPTLTDTEDTDDESELSDDDEIGYDDNNEKLPEQDTETPTLTDTDYADDKNDKDENTVEDDGTVMMGCIEKKQGSVIRRPSGVKHEILDVPKLSALRDLHLKKDNQNLPALCDLPTKIQSVIRPSEDKTKVTDDQNEGFVRTNRWFSGEKSIGLKGGADGKKSQQVNMGLRLINNSNEGTRNICFVNVCLQMFRMTGFGIFLLTQLPAMLVGQPHSSYKCSRAMLNLYSEKSSRERSAAVLRKHVANQSGKGYLNDGSQQDAEEFLTTLVDVVSGELSNHEAFFSVSANHWGSEQHRRVFLDNPADGSCKKCGQYPSSKVDDFLTLKLTVPISALTVSISSLIAEHFSESTETVRIKCTYCCPHEKQKVICSQTGFCSRPSATHNELTKSPKFLFIHLLRFSKGVNGSKVNTLISFRNELELPNNKKYEVLGAICHRGMTIKAGHYVTYLKSESKHWQLFDDTTIRSSSLEEANNTTNYILLFKQQVNDTPESVPCSENDSGEATEIIDEIDTSTIDTNVEVFALNEGSGLPLKSPTKETQALPLDAAMIPGNLETLTALCQFNDKKTSEESTSSNVDRLTILSQTKNKQTEEELDECISCLESLMNKILQERMI